MVILEPNFVDFGYEAVTPKGSYEVARFQHLFYTFSRKFQDLKAAIESCRQEMDRQATTSLVIEYFDHAEIWTQVEPGATVKPKANLDQQPNPTGDPGRSASQPLYFRGQPVAEISSQVTGPKPAIYFRGQKVSTDPTPLADKTPNPCSYRGIKR